MSKTANINIRIEPSVKQSAEDLFDSFGISVTDAINIFLRTSIMEGGFPFIIKQSQYNTESLAAKEEARRISRDPNVPSYSSMEDLKKALLQD